MLEELREKTFSSIKELQQWLKGQGYDVISTTRVSSEHKETLDYMILAGWDREPNHRIVLYASRIMRDGKMVYGNIMAKLKSRRDDD